MPRLLILAIFVGVVLLAISVIYLAATNYSARVIEPILALVGTAVVSMLLTLFFILKETRWEETFYTTVVVDSLNLPARVEQGGIDPARFRLESYRDLAVKTLGDRAMTGIEETEASLLFAQIVQVVVFEHAVGRFSDGWARTFSFPKALGNFQFGSISHEITTKAGSRNVDATTLWREIEAKNLVAAATKDSAVFRDGWVRPEGTQLTIGSMSEQYLLEPQTLFELKKPHFFEIKVTIAKGIAHAPIETEVVKLSGSGQLKAQTFLINVVARFFKERAGHPDTETFQQWARSLVQVLRYAIADEPS